MHWRASLSGFSFMGPKLDHKSGRIGDIGEAIKIFGFVIVVRQRKSLHVLCKPPKIIKFCIECSIALPFSPHL